MEKFYPAPRAWKKTFILEKVPFPFVCLEKQKLSPRGSLDSCSWIQVAAEELAHIPVGAFLCYLFPSSKLSP